MLDESGPSSYGQHLLTGQSSEATAIVRALGLDKYHIRSLQLIIEADRVIAVKTVIYPTAEQFKALGGAIEQFRGFGATIANVEFNYGSLSDLADD